MNTRYALCRFLPAIFLLLFLCGPCFAAQKISPGMERYYRAVYLLQSIGGPAIAEPVRVPPQVINTDATESLLHHPDKIFVLRSLAEDLHALDTTPPEAPLFEAYARLALGDRRRAADLLSGYLALAPYQERHYALLAALFHEISDYTSLYLISLEWAERDSSCNEKRILAAWDALFHLARYADAKAFMLQAGSCLGWPSRVYAARAALAMNDASGAEALIKEARQNKLAKSEAVTTMWERLKTQDQF